MDVFFACRGEYFEAVFDSTSAALVDIVFHNGPERERGDVVEFLDLRIDGQRLIYFVQNTLSNDAHSRRHEILVWRANGGRPRLVARRDLVTDWIPPGAQLRDFLRISHPPTLVCREVGPLTATCVEFLDSIFSFDLAEESLSVLFYPAGAKMSIIDEGHYAFYSPGGHRVFVATSN